jgi:hypothetical protein
MSENGAGFDSGRKRFHDDDRTGRFSKSGTEVNAVRVKEIILEDRRVNSLIPQ